MFICKQLCGGISLEGSTAWQSAHTCQIKMRKSSSNEHLYIFQVALFNQAEFVLLMDIGVNIQRKDSQVFYYI
jgi:hypothetical protein